jgi:predicted phage terminase large subunit-like protein
MQLATRIDGAASHLEHRTRAREHLLDFTTFTKPDYEVNWHHRALCGALDRFVSGDCRRLIVSMPPRHGKSELVSRRLPAFILGRNPGANIIACSYAADLASRMNRDVQRVLDSREYAALFPNTALSGSNVRTMAQGSYLRNSDIFEIVGHTGGYRSAGVGGGITGMGADFGIIDDPVKNQEEAASPTYREKVWEWYTTTFYTRLDREDSRVLVTMTRWHEDDLAGRLIRSAEREGSEPWETITFPAIAEPGTPNDPRAPGEPLWPTKFGAGRLAEMRVTLGPYPWAALYQQHPEPAGGGLFKRQSFRYFDEAASTYTLHRHDGDQHVPVRECIVFQTCDPAGSTRTSADFFALGTWALTPTRDLLLLDMIHTRLEGPDQPALVRGAYDRWHPAEQGIEPKGIGLTLFQQLKRDGLPVVELKADADKWTRALPMAARYEAGCVYHRAGAAWLADYETELVGFPGAAHDDMVDVAAYAFTMIDSLTPGATIPLSAIRTPRTIPSMGGRMTTIPRL